MTHPLSTQFEVLLDTSFSDEERDELESLFESWFAITKRMYAQAELSDFHVFTAAKRLFGDASLWALRRDIVMADLTLAMACALAHEPAIVTFQAMFRDDFAMAAKNSRSTLSADDIAQRVHEKLLVAQDGHPPKILSYTGKGSLRAWMRVTLARMLIDIVRAKVPETLTDDDCMLHAMPAKSNPELALMRQTYGQALSKAFESALMSLTIKQRNLLRYKYLHGLTADKLATIYQVHRATIFTWLEEARTALLAQVTVLIKQHTDGLHMDSVVAVLGSEFHVSIRRMLNEHVEPES